MFSRTSRCEPADVTDRRWSLAGRLRVKAEIIGRLTGLTVITKPVSAADDAARPVNTGLEMGAIGAIFLNGVEASSTVQTVSSTPPAASHQLRVLTWWRPDDSTDCYPSRIPAFPRTLHQPRWRSFRASSPVGSAQALVRGADRPKHTEAHRSDSRCPD